MREAFKVFIGQILRVGDEVWRLCGLLAGF